MWPFLNKPISAKDDLVELLGSMAAYNDKGHEWMRHSQEQVAEQRKEFRRELNAHISAIGTDAIHPNILVSLNSDHVLSDWSGIYVEDVKHWFAKRELIWRS